jgi:ComF family protein
VNFIRPTIDLFNRALSVFIPYTCPGCGKPCEKLICDECAPKAARIAAPYCEICGRPLPPGVSDTSGCRKCRDGAVEFDRCRSVFFYRPPVDAMVKRFKFNRNFAMGRWLRDAACERAAREPEFFEGCECGSADAVVPVPLHPFRWLRRGFNQSEFFADGFKQAWGIPRLDCLVRKRNTRPQSLLPVKERAKNVRGAFAVRKGARIEGRKLILVDDVMTTGATIDECSKVLKKAGAARVCVLTIARRV